MVKNAIFFVPVFLWVQVRMTRVMNIKERERDGRRTTERFLHTERQVQAEVYARNVRGEKQVGLCFFVLLMFKTSLTVSPHRFRSPGPQRPAQSFKDMCSLNH